MASSTIASDAGPAAASAQGYQVVARRYRPQRFADLVGQEHVAHGLSGAIESGRIGHAYLFTGARGVGKTSAARIYAKALVCDRRTAGEPCNACDSCTAISAGQDVDVVEIDAASNRGIEEMRQLRQNVAVRPARGRFKVYIIDEVHMLTREAFNALLKTLEEPPAHVKFVLCTTEPDKLPITILSRCQRFDFKTVDASAIARRLAQIVEAEGATVDPAALTLIARRAAGSMRDSQSLLEQLLGAATGAVGVDDVHAVIGTGREERIGAIVARLAARDAKAAIAAFDEALAGGADPGGVLEQVMAALRDALLASVGCGAELLLQGEGLGVDLAALGRDVGTVTLLAMLQIIDHALARMRSSSHAVVLAEMAIVRLASLDDLDALADAVARVGTAAGGEKKKPELNAGRLPPPAMPAEVRGPREAVAQETVSPPADPEPIPPPSAPEPQRQAEPGGTEPDDAGRSPGPPPGDPLEAWRRAAETVGGLAVDFADLAVRAAWREDLLQVVLPATAGTAASFLRRPEVAAALARALSEMVGRPSRHALEMEAVTDVAATSGDANGAAAKNDRPRPTVSQAALVREAAEHPLVLHARTVFDAAVRKVEPPRPRAADAPAAAVEAGPASANAVEEDERDHSQADGTADGAVGGEIDG